MRVVKAALGLINKCPAAARRDAMLHRAADLLNISPQALGQDLRREQRKKRPAPRHTEESQATPPPAPQKTYPRQETSLLELLVHHYSEVQPLVHDYLPVRYLTDPICRELVELLMVDLPESLTENLHDFDEETQKVISRIQVEESRTIDQETPARDLATMYIVLFWKRQVKQELAGLDRRMDLSNEERYIERLRLVHIKKILENEKWEEAKLAIEAHLQIEA
jgi:DNA primase